MQRWLARLLVLAMIVPAFAPLAMAYAMPAQAPHCIRQPAKPVMECHPGMSMPMAPVLSGTEFRATHECCQNHDCCRSMAAPRWAQTQFQLFVDQALPSAEKLRVLDPQLISSIFFDSDSARAPPRR
jgi:hypothetical protein